MFIDTIKAIGRAIIGGIIGIIIGIIILYFSSMIVQLVLDIECAPTKIDYFMFACGVGSLASCIGVYLD